MGIQDRDYYRNPSSGGFGQFVAGQSSAVFLVALHAAVFFVQVATLVRGQPGEFERAITFQPALISEGEVWRLVTGFFASPSFAILFLVCNLYVLWWAGSELCALYGSREFAAFYVAAGLFSSVLTYFYCSVTGSVGAWLTTAPVTATVTLFACHYPRRTVLLFFVIPVPVTLLVVLIAAKDALFVERRLFAVEAVAGLAAIVWGIAYHRLHWRIWPLVSGRSFSAANNRRTRLQVYREREPVRAAAERGGEDFDQPAAGPVTDEQLEARLDAVLDKVQKQGQASLSAEERELLFQASELYRRRRNAESRQ